MSQVDEAAEQRETYGNAPGWSQSQKELAADAALPLGTKGAPAASPPADAEADSSPAQEAPQEQVSQEETVTQPEKPFNMPPPERWEEVIRKQKDAEARAERAEQLAQLAIQKFQQPQAPVQPDVDPYAGMDDATAAFYRNMDKRIEQKAQMIADVRMQPILQAADGLRRHQAEQDIKSFRAENPDIKPGSPEELAIAAYVQQNFDLNSAKKLALFDKLEAENRALKGKQASIPQKRAAAQSESSAGIPQTAGLPGKPGGWKDSVATVHDSGGSFKDMLKAAFK